MVDTQAGGRHGEEIEHRIGKVVRHADDFLDLVFDEVHYQKFFYEAELSFAQVLHLFWTFQIAADLFREPGIFLHLLQDGCLAIGLAFLFVHPVQVD